MFLFMAERIVLALSARCVAQRATAAGNYDETYCFRLLNANEISCIRTDLFKDLTSLTLLSLYDNNIRSLANGTFANLRSIKTLFVLS